MDKNWHWRAALEWAVLEDVSSWIVSNPTNGACLRGFFRLKSERIHPSERNYEFAGIVSSTVLPVSASMWLALVRSGRRYRSCPPLLYSLSTDEVGKCDSNRFMAGIINSIGGTTNAPLHTYFLGNRPVPSNHFETYCGTDD